MSINKRKVTAAAQKYIQKGAYDRAINELRKLLAEDPSDARTLLKIADLQHRKGDTTAAADIYLALAIDYQDRGFYPKAVAVFKQLIDVQPQNADALEALGDLYTTQQLPSDALIYYQHALKVFRALEDLDGELRILAQLAELFPQEVTTHTQLAHVFIKRGQIPEAIQHLQYAARELWQSQRYAEFEQAAETLLKHHNGDTFVLKQLAGLYLRSGRARQALPKLQGLYRTNDRDPETLDLLIQSFTELKQSRQAIELLKQLVNVLTALGDQEGVVTAWKQVHALDPTDDNALKALGLKRSPPPMLSASTVLEIVPIARPEPPPRRPPPPPRRSPPPTPPPPRPRPIPIDQVTPNEAPLDPSKQQILQKLLTDCDVFLRYNLIDQAEDLLKRAGSEFPHNLELQDRRIAIAEKRQASPEVIGLLLQAASDSWLNDRGRSIAYVRRALGFDPGDVRIHQHLSGLGLTPETLDEALSSRSGMSRSLARPPSNTSMGRRIARPRTRDEIVHDLLGSPSTSLTSSQQTPTASVRSVDPPTPVSSRAVARSPSDILLDSELSIMKSDDIMLDDVLLDDFNLDDDFFSSALGEDPAFVDEEEESVYDQAEAADVSQALSDDADFFESLQTLDGADDIAEELEDELEEAELYISQRRWEEAQDLLDDLLKEYGRHPLILATLRRLQSVSS